MNYIDAYWDKKKDIVFVSERSDKKRILKTIHPVYEFFYENPSGNHTALTGQKATKVICKKYGEFCNSVKKIKESGKKTFESDMNVLFKTLERYYTGKPNPEINKVFFDIEAEMDEETGSYASPDNPYMPINAISVYNSFAKIMSTVVLLPPTLSYDEGMDICKKFNNTFLFTDEKKMIDKFIELIEDADIVSGWNSEFYDIPYIVNRIKKLFGNKHTSKLCLWGIEPKEKEEEINGKTHKTYELYGRVHQDYLQHYKKNVAGEKESYKLDDIAEEELGEKKVEYEGTLHELWQDDFQKFIEYSRQDVELLKKLEDVKKFLDLANTKAHHNTVTIQATLGSVALIDQAIINKAHSMGKIVFDKVKHEESGIGAAGAYCANPKIGYKRWFGVIDINSLYPSVIRSLNMSPETLIGQIDLDYTMQWLNDKIKNEKLTKQSKGVTEIKWTEAWNGIFSTLEFKMVHDKTDDLLTIRFIDGTVHKIPAKDVYDFVFNSNENIIMSANGTLFRTDIEGVIPALLTEWYSGRKVMQKKYKGMEKQIADLLVQGADKEKINELTKEKEYWDMQQYLRKILLNSLYGCILNPHSRFYDPRIGQSVTLTGRSITYHMCSKTNELITGEYQYDGECVIMADTDSVDGDTMIRTEDGNKKISEMFVGEILVDQMNGKEYTRNDVSVKSINEYKIPEYYYRHKVKKKKYRIEDEFGNVVYSTDHPVMVIRDGVMVPIKPSDMLLSDQLIVENSND